MTTHHIVLFCAALGAPFIFFRTALFIISKPLEQITPYTREGLKFHHFHYGMMLLVVGILGLLLLGNTNFTIILTGLGLGTALDEFFTSLNLPEPEPTVTKLYQKSFLPTLGILTSVIAIVIVAGYLVR